MGKFKTQCFIYEQERSETGDKNFSFIENEVRQKHVLQRYRKIQGFREELCDMVACEFRYFDKCMRRYLNQRFFSQNDKSKTPHEQTFAKLLA